MSRLAWVILAWAVLFVSLPVTLPVSASELSPVLTGRDGARLLLIPAGVFRKGSTKAEVESATKLAKRYHPYSRSNLFSDEPVSTEVFLPAYYIDETEISIFRYMWKGQPLPDLMKRFPLPPKMLRSWNIRKGIEPWQLAVVNIAWKDAAAHCRSEGRRLPTSDEWEKAARGIDGRRFPWGNRFDPARLNSYEAGLSSAVPVGSYPAGASPYGVLDMAGNVWEWVADWYDPPSWKDARRKVVRGGGWGHSAAFARSANLGAVWPGERHPSIGFRCAKDP